MDIEFVFLNILHIAHESCGEGALFLGVGGDGEESGGGEGRRNSCIIQSVLMPLAALPL